MFTLSDQICNSLHLRLTAKANCDVGPSGTLEAALHSQQRKPWPGQYSFQRSSFCYTVAAKCLLDRCLEHAEGYASSRDGSPIFLHFLVALWTPETSLMRFLTSRKFGLLSSVSRTCQEAAPAMRASLTYMSQGEKAAGFIKRAFQLASLAAAQLWGQKDHGVSLKTSAATEADLKDIPYLQL